MSDKNFLEQINSVLHWSTSSQPDYYISHKDDCSEAKIELIVPGFTKDTLVIEATNTKLDVTGVANNKVDINPWSDLLFKYKAKYDFKRSFTIDGFKVSGSNLKNGILTINLVKEAVQSTKIDIVEDL